MAEEQTPPQPTDQADTAPAEESAPTTVTEEARPPAPSAKADQGGYYWGTGRRKTAVARVRVRPGDGKFLINGREIKTHFPLLRDQESIIAPLKATKTEGKMDVMVNVHGGGFTGQAGAVLLGLSRALKGYDSSLEATLRTHDYLTRDPREVERKKYGQRGARRKFQFSKR